MKNRFNSRSTPDYAPHKKEEPKEVVLHFSPCCVCGKKITDGFYGRFGDGGVCSKSCNNAKEKENGNILSSA